ncbi:MAG: serine/threonine protein kinase [Thermoguttaceae bacterium]|nr:serine/threonine protein kinase [Thermoguttaceae bacterium]
MAHDSDTPTEPTSTQTFAAPTPVAKRGRRAPTKIGPYLVERELGRGAHGRVYAARHSRNRNRLVALKVVENRGNLDSLLLEPEILSRLEHPGIVGLGDYFLDGDDVVVALEYVEGEDLETCLRQRGPFSPDEVRDLLVQMADALAHAHRAGVIHRDIKLSNILVDRSGPSPRYVLSDFGISRISEGIQTSSRLGGTYYFMAPEQLQGRPGPQSDLWSLGVVAYVLLTGTRPFEGKNVDELSRQILYGTPVPPSQRMSQPMDDDLEQIILELLEKSLNQRTESADRLLASLRRAERRREESSTTEPARRWPGRATFERRLQRRVVWNWALFWVFVGLVLLPLGVVPGTVALLGVLVFYAGQSARPAGWRWSLAAVALGVMGAATWLRARSTLPDFLEAAASGLDEGAQRALQSIYVSGLFVYYLVVAPAAIHFFAKARRLRRDLALRRLLRAAGADAARRLAQLRSLVDHHPEDSDLHHRFAEALLAQGHAGEAAIEARLIIQRDPYHFAANLLLAHAYLELKCYSSCRRVCDHYLAASGHCFEFAELRQRCDALSGAAP